MFGSLQAGVNALQHAHKLTQLHVRMLLLGLQHTLSPHAHQDQSQQQAKHALVALALLLMGMVQMLVVMLLLKQDHFLLDKLLGLSLELLLVWVLLSWSLVSSLS